MSIQPWTLEQLYNAFVNHIEFHHGGCISAVEDPDEVADPGIELAAARQEAGEMRAERDNWRKQCKAADEVNEALDRDRQKVKSELLEAKVNLVGMMQCRDDWRKRAYRLEDEHRRARDQIKTWEVQCNRLSTDRDNLRKWADELQHVLHKVLCFAGTVRAGTGEAHKVYTDAQLVSDEFKKANV